VKSQCYSKEFPRIIWENEKGTNPGKDEHR
jgi:hypothetical protein